VYRIRPEDYVLAIFTGMFFFSPPATAVTIEPGVGIGVESTDNATLIANNEVRDLIAVANVAVKIDAGSGPFHAEAITSVRFQGYRQNTFSDQNYFNLNATAGWAMLKNRLDWQLQDFFSQQPINSLDPATPANTQNINVLTFGPNIRFSPSGRQSITLRPEYRKFSYEIQNLDNEHESLDVSWNYKMFRSMSMSLRAGVSKVDYEEPAISDNTLRNIHVVASGTRSRSNYSVDLGTTHVERATGSSERGLTGRASWEFNLTRYSDVRAVISSNLTDTSTGLLDAARNPESGDFANVQTATEILRNKVARLAYTRKDANLKSKVWGEIRNLDYGLSTLDRSTQAAGLRFGYPLTATVSTGLYVDANETKLTGVARKDSRYNIGANINHRWSRKLRSVIDIKYQNNNSNLNIQDYSELSLFVGLIYGYGQVTRVNRTGGAL